MDTSNTKNRYYIILFLLVLFSCKKKEVSDKCLPLYQFNQEITFDGYTDDELQLATVNYNNSITGKISIDKNSKSVKKYGRIYFDSINDTICKKDTLILNIANKKYLITEIVQKSVKVSLGNDRPAFINFKINNKEFRGKGVIKK
ncbi:hypothetical protein QSV08_15395 [Maribacter sp. BPC-D8]|uniref:hypothetical protein n=1 Tax=Maribacter sp. BPC-D8 TaxID=3053613 RepID=UPI002B49F6DF|nr:hypothetical protein [Maribacter sp. BPC-D8]WRI28600.1 hypothetical protein QSV08_15395 [Maribacter sp. BPC-D8]